MKPQSTTPEKQVAAQIKQTLLGTKQKKAVTDFASSLTKSYCHGSKIKYQVGYTPMQDACTVTTHERHDDAVATLSLADALVELQALTERLRRECPWDREQTARTIVPHTVEEAYEVADAAFAGDDAKLLDEIGDLLYQSFFLALLLAGTRQPAISKRCAWRDRKLVARHPHVFGDAEAAHRRAGARALGEQQARAGGTRGHLPRRAGGPAGAAPTRRRCRCARARSASSTRTSRARSPTSTTRSAS